MDGKSFLSPPGSLRARLCSSPRRPLPGRYCQERTRPTAVAALCERANDDIWATTPLARWARVLSMELHDAHCAEQCLFFLSETKPPAQRSRICPFPLSTRPTRSHPQVILMVGFRVAALFALLYRSRPTGDRAY